MSDKVIEKGKVRIEIKFEGDTAIVSYYFDKQLVDTLAIPHTNAAIDFIAKNTNLKENTIRRYIYKNQRDEFVKNKLISFHSDRMVVLDIENLIKTLKK